MTPEQIRYAFDDVRCLLAAWGKLSGRLESMGRTEWAREEFERLAHNASPEEPAAEEKWRKLRGLGSLDRRRLALVRALFHWREDAAARTNRPARSIVRDDLIIEIARRNPTRGRDLQTLRGLPHRDIEAIVQTVAQARELPMEECPAPMERDQDPPQVLLAASVMTAVLGDVCARLRLAPNLVASNQDVKRLVRARFVGAALPTDMPLTQGWRADAILPELLPVLDGSRLVRIADVTAAAPFAYVAADEGAKGPSAT